MSLDGLIEDVLEAVEKRAAKYDEWGSVIWVVSMREYRKLGKAIQELKIEKQEFNACLPPPIVLQTESLTINVYPKVQD